MLLLSGRGGRDGEDLQLDSIRVVEDALVIPRHVRAVLRLALELGAGLAQPLGALVDDRARCDLEREMVQTRRVAVDAPRRLRLAQTDRRLAPAQIPDRLAALAFDLADPVPAERAEQLAIKRQAALDRGNDQVDVMDAAGA